jgi:D-lactate dehydrogenase (cytochrome)
MTLFSTRSASRVARSFSTQTAAGVSDALLSRLEAAAARVSTNKHVCDRHGDDESHHKSVPPQAVVYAHSTEEVQAVVRVCAETRTPIIPFGTGTSLEGHILAVKGGISIDLSEMNAVLEVNDEDMDCRVQAGVTRLQLNNHLRDTGLQFPVDPGADASIGGMAACGASGTSTVRYGTMRENTLGLTAVTASGEVVHTGGRARKSSAGYDLTRLLIGSEGTLAIITEAQLKLHPLPSSVSAATCTFPTLTDAANAVAQLLQCGVPVSRSEIVHASAIAAFNAYAKDVPDKEELPHIFLELEGVSDEAVAAAAEVARMCCDDNSGGAFEWASDEAERKRLWAARHGTYYASLALRPGSKGIVTDAVVPISRMAEVMSATADDVEDAGVMGPIFGHAGDGNFHCILLVKEDDPPEYVERLNSIHHRLIRRTLEAGGSCTGEHGIGFGKKEYLREQHGEPAIEMMRTLKRALDPHGIFNPAKVIDVD